MSSETNPPAQTVTNPSNPDPTPTPAPAAEPRRALLPPSPWELAEPDPWPDPVNGRVLLDDLETALRRFVVLPEGAAKALALWVLHTYAFPLREVSTYIGIESPEKRCGKTTLLTVLLEVVNRPIVASNISSPAFFRLIAETHPTLLIDEADTLLQGNDQLRGILNSGYTRKTAYVVRVGSKASVTPSPVALPDAANPPTAHSRLARFSCWCPKVIAAIGQLPETLADRCIIIRMQRKSPNDQCDRLRNLDGTALRRRCARFVLDHAQRITSARPSLPRGLNDRSEDVWEPLLALADLAGGAWPQQARQTALHLSAGAQESSPIGVLLLDLMVLFVEFPDGRASSRDLVHRLNSQHSRPWTDAANGKPVTELWLAQKLRPYGIRPKPIRFGDILARGYLREDFSSIFVRYIPRAELETMIAQFPATPPSPTPNIGGANSASP